MEFNKVHCLFEQSGTFKEAFKKLGYEAFDYDINKTEHVDVSGDLFTQINLAKDGYTSEVFNKIDYNDLVFAFFPCTYFSDQSQLLSRGDNFGMKDWSKEKKLKYSMSQMKMRSQFYVTLCSLCLLAFKKGFKLIIENPYGTVNFLKQFFPIKPGIVLRDRRKLGDEFKKPTQFFFINCAPALNLYNEFVINEIDNITVEKKHGFERSIISHRFAENFIKTFIVVE